MKNKALQVIILTVLFIFVIIQGIVILDYYLDTFSLGIFNEEEENITYYKSFEEDIADQFIKPYRIILKSGVSDIWIIDKNNSMLYNPILKDFKEIMINMINVSPSLKYEDNEWTNLYAQEGYTFEFKGSIPFEYLSYMINANEYINLNEDISKIFIKPESDNNVTIYLKTKNNVYAYNNIDAKGYFIKENYDELYSQFENNSDTMKYNFYSKIIGNEKFPDIDINIDIPIIYDIKATSNKNLIDVNPFIIINEYNNLEEMSVIEEKTKEIKKQLLGSTYDKYKTIYNANGDIFFINEYNIFSIYKNSNFKFRFTPSSKETEAGDIKSAFLNSIEIINSIFKLNDGVVPKLIVSNVIKEQSYYTFSFDYTYNNMPIKFEETKNAITISANATRVIEASGKLYNVVGSIEDEIYSFDYYTSFLKIINEEQLQLLQIDAKDITIGYLRGSGISEFLSPILIIEKQDGSILNYEIKRVGD